METKIDYSKVDKILQQHNYDSTNTISILQDIQHEFRYLPQDVLVYVAEKIHISTAKICSVATFYENFSLEPKGKYVIRVCNGTACHVRKSIPILEELRKTLNLSDKKSTTDDMMFTIETVSCLGACGLAPVVTVNDKVHPSMTPESAKELIHSIKEAEKQ